jgi:IS5 family transposase
MGGGAKDKDARWTKKNDESFYGYKNHIGVDKAHKLIRKWEATDAAVHDSQKLDDLLDLCNTAKRPHGRPPSVKTVPIRDALRPERCNSPLS